VCDNKLLKEMVLSSLAKNKTGQAMDCREDISYGFNFFLLDVFGKMFVGIC
jgi:hypothetical protein